MTHKKPKRLAEIVQFPQHQLHFSEKEVANITENLLNRGIIDFVAKVGLEQTYKARADALAAATDADTQGEAIKRTLLDLEVQMRVVMTLIRDKDKYAAETWLASLTASASRLAAHAAMGFDTLMRMPNEPGETSPSAGASLVEGLNLHNRIANQVCDEIEAEDSSTTPN